ncbi:MAG: sec-independent protein translocase protein TatC [Solirubrobacteraceae bacterium]|jgi:sec-independent protein translocase protein TatC|nr:sec-independent protein translocase protein TatC [Solirubrobacteraceae bacterium]
MATALRTVRHDDQLSLVEHLDELRTRLIVSLFAFLVCFAFAFWQNDAILKVVNRPFIKATSGQKAKGALSDTRNFNREVGSLADATAGFATAIQADDVNPGTKASAARLAKQARTLAANIPKSERQPVTLGVAEPFTSTFKVAAYAALLIALPIMLWQLYAFVLPAFSPTERKVALPLMMMVPFLFVAGAVFAYFVVLPSAIKVLQNFNSDNFDILVQAKDLYRFTILTCIALGALFQVPIGILALVRMEILSVAQLRGNRRYAVLVIAVLAMLLPGTDPVTMLLSMLPLVVLYEGSILIAALLDRRARRRAAREGPEPDLLDPDD